MTDIFKGNSIIGSRIGEYQIIEKIGETHKSVIFRALRISDDLPVVVKFINKEFPSMADIAHIKQEHAIIQNLISDGAIKSYGILEAGHRIAMVLEDTGGVSLKEFLDEKKLDMRSFLDVAISMSTTLGEIHRCSIIHQDIKPNNIIVHLKDDIIDDVKITDFGISMIRDREIREMYNPGILEGTLPYISPEQTGRMNISVDYRTDLYSLGITFYEMLTGEVPFRSDDPLEIIHSHIARQPVPVHEKNKDIPIVISDIITKLLQKEPEFRYQSAFGLVYDLEQCQGLLMALGTIEPFPLGKKDLPEKFTIPRRLFGRERELRELMNTFEKAAAGNKVIMQVSGEPGIGKTFLINEINKPIVSKRGFFISGKYEKYRRYRPYSSITQAFQGLIRQILTESDERIDVWKKKLLGTLGSNGGVITRYIPEVEYLIGPQPEVPDMSPEESQNRFIHLFKQFTGIFAGVEHPLTIFLDDMQWADYASLNLIKSIMEEPMISYFFLICSYRDTEVTLSHPLMIVLEDIGKNDIMTRHIHLEPFNLETVHEFVSAVLHNPEEPVGDLADIIFSKTNGNPFFMNQFIKNLYEERKLLFTPAAGWQWDFSAIQSMEVTDNVLDLLTHKISRLSASGQEVLKLCACIGNRFDLETLAALYGHSIEKTLEDLGGVIDEGLVFYSRNMYRIFHDKIQEAAYSLIDEEDKKKFHLDIGRILEKSTEDDSPSNIFNIVDHFNMGRDLIEDDEERLHLARLNLEAGHKAKSSAAYESSLEYFENGMFYIGEGWENSYRVTLDIYTGAAEAAYLNSRYQEMAEYSKSIIENSKSLLDTVPLYEIKIRTFMAENKLTEAVATGLEVLEKLGHKFPRKPGMIHVLKALLKVKLALIGKKTARLLDHRMMENPRLLAALRIITSVNSVVYWTNPDLLPLLILKVVYLSIRYGNASTSPYNYSGFGLINCSIGNIRYGNEFGRMAIDLVEKMDFIDQKPRTYFVVYTFIHSWENHVNETLEPLLDVYRRGLDTGDIEFASHAAMVYCYYAFLAGSELGWLEKEFEKYTEAVERLNQITDIHVINIYHQALLNLTGKSRDKCRLKGARYNEDEMLPVHHEEHDRTSIFHVYLNRLMLCYTFRNYREALQYAEETEKALDGAVSVYALPVFHFYDSLVRLALYEKAARREKSGFLKKVKSNQKKLKKWLDHSPMNIEHKYILINAEVARIMKKKDEAEKYYTIAADKARKNNFIQEEAIVHELAALFHGEAGDSKKMIDSMTRSRDCYAQWGALLKVIELEKDYPGMPGKIHDLTQSGLEGKDDTESLSATAAVSLDISTLVKASRAISGEIDLGRLLERIITIAFENAGAQRGCLIVQDDDNNLYIEAYGSAHEGIHVLQSIAVDESDLLSRSILKYVYKTGENVVLGRAVDDELFGGDDYIKKNNCMSILCAPIKHKGAISGFLYLENNLTAHAFTPGRLELLRLLSSQAAISIENSRLMAHRENAAKIEKEMEIAANIQKVLLPEMPSIPGFEITGFMEPADDVGGDYYDVLESSGSYWIIVGDVSGHGVPSGLVMMMVQSSIHAILHRQPGITPATLLTDVNAALFDNFKKISDEKYMTITAMTYRGGGTFNFAGQHLDIIVYRKSERKIEFIKTRGMWLGIVKDISEMMNTGQLTLEPEDVMLLYTDGITEARDSEEKMYGRNRLADILLKSGAKTTDEIRDDILNSVRGYINSDDISLLIVKRKE